MLKIGRMLTCLRVWSWGFSTENVLWAANLFCKHRVTYLPTQKLESGKKKKPVRFCWQVCWRVYEQTKAFCWCPSTGNAHVPASVQPPLWGQTGNAVSVQKWEFWISLKLPIQRSPWAVRSLWVFPKGKWVNFNIAPGPWGEQLSVSLNPDGIYYRCGHPARYRITE